MRKRKEVKIGHEGGGKRTAGNREDDSMQRAVKRTV